MSKADRDRWNSRYREGAYAERRHASAMLVECVPPLTSGSAPPRALDLACGAGRNALYLAGLGYRVDAVDISAEALARAERDARTRDLSINWIEHDLDRGLPANLPDYDLAVIIRYLDLALVQEAARHLRPGGQLNCEVHLQTDEPVSGPRTATFRARPGALRAAAQDLDIVSYWEGITRDPDGQPVALARLVAAKPAPL